MRNAATADFPVVNDGVWHCAHPTAVKGPLPFVIDVAPPGVVAEGVGGARKRMKNVNFSIELMASIGVGASGSVMLLGLSA